jgi:ParB/RepB/Spo0J family partition protein
MGAAAGFGGNIQQLEVLRIVASEMNPRKHFDEQALQELADSIVEHGLLEPIVVREITRGSMCYEIIAGERRWRASEIAGLTTIPAVVLEDIDDRKALELALVENLVRRDIDPIEEAEGYAKLREMGHKVLDIAAKVNRSQETVSNAMRLLKLPEEVREHIRDGRLSMSHGKALASFVEYPDLLDYKLRQALEGATTKDVEKVGYDYTAINAGAYAHVQTYSIGVDAAKECLNCTHRRECSGTHRRECSGVDGWLCLDVKCYQEKLETKRTRTLKEALVEAGLSEDAQLRRIQDVSDYISLNNRELPPGCRGEHCEHREMVLNGVNYIMPVCTNPQCFRDLPKAAAVQEQGAYEDARKELVFRLRRQLIEPENINKITAIAMIYSMAGADESILRAAADHLNIDIDCKAIEACWDDDDTEVLELLSKVPPETLTLFAAEVRLRGELNHSRTPMLDWLCSDKAPELPVCDRCGQPCETVYRDRYGNNTYCSSECEERHSQVAHICCTSAEDGIKYGVQQCNDIEVLKEALDHENKNSQPRKGLIKAIEGRINRLNRCPADLKPEGSVYYDNKGTEYFVSDGISNGKDWMTVRRSSPEKGTHRVCSIDLPCQPTRELAEADLVAYAKAHSWRLSK